MQELWLDLQEKYRSGNIKKKEEQLYKKWGKALKLLSADPGYPSLQTHEIEPLSRRYGMKVWQSYLGIPFFTITVCPSTTTFPLFGNSICSMIPSYTSPFFICCPFFLFFLSAAFNRRKAPGSPPKLSCRFVYSHFNFLRYLHLQSNRQNHHRNHLQSLPDNPV